MSTATRRSKTSQLNHAGLVALTVSEMVFRKTVLVFVRQTIRKQFLRSDDFLWQE